MNWLKLDLNIIGCQLNVLMVKYSRKRQKVVGSNPLQEVVDAHYWGVPYKDETAIKILEVCTDERAMIGARFQ